MDKRSYYVSVQSKSISEVPGVISSPFEILATAEEIITLQALIRSLTEKDDATMVFMPITPYSSYQPRESNQEYDTSVVRIYSMLYELGTEETRKQIIEMNVLEPNEAVTDEGQN